MNNVTLEEFLKSIGWPTDMSFWKRCGIETVEQFEHSQLVGLVFDCMSRMIFKPVLSEIKSQTTEQLREQLALYKRNGWYRHDTGFWEGVLSEATTN